MQPPDLRGGQGTGPAQDPATIWLRRALCGTIWWAYFDVTSRITERAPPRWGRARSRSPATATYLHLPMIIGIIMMALGLKKVLSYVTGDDGHTLVDPIYGVPLAALYGAALYLLAHGH